MALRVTDRDSWEPRRFHSVSDNEHTWKLTDEGILVHGEEQERRTKGEPLTLRRITNAFVDEISEAEALTGVPAQLIAAVVATESGGKPEAERHEKHLNDVSIGLTQTLTATAQQLAIGAPTKLELGPIASIDPVPRGGNIEQWREVLRDPKTSIRLGAWYLSYSSATWDLRLDPVLCYAAYNAGSPRATDERPWGVHYYRKVYDSGKVFDAMDHFVAWYGDARAVYGVC